MPIISAFPTGESTVDYTGPKSGLPSLEEGKVAYVTDEKRLYTGNADGTNTQVPNADDVKTDVSDAVSSHNSATDAHADKFAKYLPLNGGTMTGGIKGIKTPTEDTMPTPKSYVDGGLSSKADADLSNVVLGFEFKESTLPQSDSWCSVAYGNGKFVAVAGSGGAAYSNNGITWTPVTLPSSASWSSVTYGNGKFVAVAEGSDAAAYSTDGVTWTVVTLPSSASWSFVAYGNGKFVAVAGGGSAAYSTDGITWTVVTLPSSVSWCSVTYGDGKFVAVAEGSDTAAYASDVVDRLVGAGLAKAPVACKVTLSASGWDSTAKTQSATVSGVLEDEIKQLIMPMPAGTSMSAYNEAGIQMTAQGDNSVTFTADTVPKADVEVWVVVQSVNDVTPPPPLDQASWDYISKQSLAGNAKNIWAVGDCKKIKLSGTASKLSLNTELYVYILDFDHDSSTVGGTKDGITFGTFKTALTDGKDVCLVSGYNDNSDFRMNTTNANSGGWKNSDMRYNILGSTNTQNGNATATTATSPKSNTLMSCLPADLRAVMRPMCVYTDNTGGGSDTASYVTTTIDFLPLLAEFEIHGTRNCANSAEKNNQTQYAYFKNGSSKVKYRHDSQSSAMNWWSRSPYSRSSSSFCSVYKGGGETGDTAVSSRGVAPAFKV